MMKEFGSNFELSYTPGKGKKQHIIDADEWLNLRSAREALFLIAEKNCEKKTIILPALCCSSMIQPFLQLGFTVKYYKLTARLEVDYEHLSSIVEDNSLLLIIKYYGKQTYNLQEIRKIINGRNIQLIQDCTQHIFTEYLYDDVDYHVGSIRKWIAIPDGAFLQGAALNSVSKSIIKETNDPFIQESYAAMVEKSKYLASQNQSIKDSYRKRNTFCLNYLKGHITPHYMSDLSYEIIEKDIDFESVKKKRGINYKALKKAIADRSVDVEVLSIDETCPLCLPIVTDRQLDIQQKLAIMGVYCQVLWPISLSARALCQNSKKFSDQMLALPCDQRYSEEDMLCIANALGDVVEVVKNEY